MIWTILFILLGWVVGVGVNHAANVLPLKETLWQRPFYRPSHVPKPPLAWSGLAAYLSGVQRCPQTGQSIGLRPPLVELALPILFVFLHSQFGLTIYLGFLLVYTTILVLLTVTDLEHRLIQNVVILPAILIAIAGSFFTPYFDWRLALFGGATGFVIFYILALLARGGLGSGDVTLSAFLGLILAFPTIIFALVFGMFFGGIVSAMLLVTRRVTLKTFIPYGPFLMVVGWAFLVWGDAIIAWLW